MVHTQPELTGQGARCNPQWPASPGKDGEVGKTENVLEGRTEYPVPDEGKAKETSSVHHHNSGV